MPHVVTLDSAASGYVQVLGGPPATVTMRSGQVTLDPGQAVGQHSTESYEEVVVVISGNGEMRVHGGPTLALSPNTVAYCPPATVHDVVNTGITPLRYLYIVARAR